MNCPYSLFSFERKVCSVEGMHLLTLPAVPTASESAPVLLLGLLVRLFVGATKQPTGG